LQRVLAPDFPREPVDFAARHRGADGDGRRGIGEEVGLDDSARFVLGELRPLGGGWGCSRSDRVGFGEHLDWW
jgi:hypothetical protein